jgi:hypothetical protein
MKKTNKKIGKKQSHLCPDGVEYGWISRVENPVACPRCKSRRDVGGVAKNA